MMSTDGECERACARLAVGCYSLMDLGRYKECADLFAQDGSWVRGGKMVTGPTEILQSLSRRPAAQITRHVVTNVCVVRKSGTTADASAIYMAFRGAVGSDGDAPRAVVDCVGDLDFRFVHTDGSWLIAHLRPSPVFHG